MTRTAISTIVALLFACSAGEQGAADERVRSDPGRESVRQIDAELEPADEQRSSADEPDDELAPEEEPEPATTPPRNQPPPAEPEPEAEPPEEPEAPEPEPELPRPTPENPLVYDCVPGPDCDACKAELDPELAREGSARCLWRLCEADAECAELGDDLVCRSTAAPGAPNDRPHCREPKLELNQVCPADELLTPPSGFACEAGLWCRPYGIAGLRCQPFTL